MSAPADRDASRLYYSYRIIKGGGGGGDPSRSYAVSAPADRDAPQLDYSYRIIKGGGGYVICSPVAMGDTSRDTQGGGGGS